MGVSIKIGDGKTIFKELPILTDISNIHPDWHETDTSSPNYIWHKPITNSDMFYFSDKMALVLEDKELKEALDSKVTKTYHTDEYCLIKELLSEPDLFTHPHDLIIEEDNTWGHYDIVYNTSETNHAPRYFYQNNIVQNIESVKYSENSAGYQYRLEYLLEDLIVTEIKKNGEYLNLFTNMIYDLEAIPENPKYNDYVQGFTYRVLTENNNYKYYDFDVDYTDNSCRFIELSSFYDSDNFNDFVRLYADAMADYLVMHQGKIEYQMVYELCKDQLENSLNILEIDQNKIKWEDLFDLIRKYTGFLNESMMHKDNANQIQLGVSEGQYQYFEINNELIIDSNNKCLYFNKNRLQHYYDTAHKNQTYKRVQKVGDKEIFIPFIIKGLVEGKDYSIDFGATNKIDKVDPEQTKRGSSGFTYPILAEESFEKSFPYANIYIKFNDKEKKYLYTPDAPLNEVSLPTEIVNGEEHPWRFTYGDIISVYDIYDPVNWTLDCNKASINNPVTLLFTQKELDGAGRYIDLDKDLSNILITKIVKDEFQKNVETPLTYFTDYTYDVYQDSLTGEIIKSVRLTKKVTEPCTFSFSYNRPEKLIKNILWSIENKDITNISLGYTTSGTGNIVIRKTCPETKMNWSDPGFERMGPLTFTESQLASDEMAWAQKKFSYWADKDYNVYFNDALYEDATVRVEESEIIVIDRIDEEKNTIVLKDALINDTIFYFNYFAQADGELKIKIYYKLRRLDDKYLSGYQSDWNENDPTSFTHILNRPLYKETEGQDIGKIKMPSAEIGEYTNSGEDYYEFFVELIRQACADMFDDEAMADLEGRIKELERWRYEDISPYIKDLQNFYYEVTNGKGEIEGYGGDFATADGETPEQKWKNSGVIQALKDLIDKVSDLDKRVTKLEDTSDVYIGEATPPYDADGKPKYKMWVNTAKENGNGVIYYWKGKAWTPVSSVWSPPDSGNEIK